MLEFFQRQGVRHQRSRIKGTSHNQIEHATLFVKGSRIGGDHPLLFFKQGIEVERRLFPVAGMGKKHDGTARPGHVDAGSQRARAADGIEHRIHAPAVCKAPGGIGSLFSGTGDSSGTEVTGKRQPVFFEVDDQHVHAGDGRTQDEQMQEAHTAGAKNGRTPAIGEARSVDAAQHAGPGLHEDRLCIRDMIGHAPGGLLDRPRSYQDEIREAARRHQVFLEDRTHGFRTGQAQMAGAAGNVVGHHDTVARLERVHAGAQLFDGPDDFMAEHHAGRRGSGLQFEQVRTAESGHPHPERHLARAGFRKRGIAQRRAFAAGADNGRRGPPFGNGHGGRKCVSQVHRTPSDFCLQPHRVMINPGCGAEAPLNFAANPSYKRLKSTMFRPEMHDGIAFRKMNGLGNDFVVVDVRVSGRRFSGAEIARISDRATGIGCDQFIVLEPARPGFDVFMRIYNGIGEEVEACGNATRCIARLVMDENGTEQALVDTVAGVLVATPAGPDRITVDMGRPRLAWDEIPLAEKFHDTRAIELQIGPIDDPILHSPAVVNIGNPHAIFFVDDVDAIDLAAIGPMIEHHPMFPERANITIAQVTDQDQIRIRVWERGAGLTRACGTAACATGVAAIRKRLSGRVVEIVLPGGPLQIEWRESDEHVLMTGPFELEYEGVLTPELVSGSAA